MARISPELFNPQSSTFTNTSPLPQGRGYNTATLLPNGKVYVVGGNTRSTADLYDWSANSWTETATGALNDAYYSASALLPNGKVLTVNMSAAFLYNPATDTFAYIFSPPTGFFEGFRLTPLPNGKVLMTGYGGTGAVLYNPASGSAGAFGPAGAMLSGRAYRTATLLPNGKVLVAGGSESPGQYRGPRCCYG